MRGLARELGYALAVHGSLARDIDVVAVPWAEEAAPALVLMRALKDLIGAGWTSSADSNEILEGLYPDGVPTTVVTRKPHGRVSCSLYLTEVVYFDLSVMPLVGAVE